MTPSVPWIELAWAFGTATLAGLLIGAEREWTRHDAGVRTNALVAIGACLFGILSRTVFAVGDGDPGRLAAQVVTGIGFIGAGVIMQRRARVIGLTTASALWVSAGAGLAAGAGEYALALAAATLVLLVQTLVRVLERRLLALQGRERGPLREFVITIQMPRGRDRVLSRIVRDFTGDGRVRLHNASVEPQEGGQQKLVMRLLTRESAILRELQAHLAVSGYLVLELRDQGVVDAPLLPRRRRMNDS